MELTPDKFPFGVDPLLWRKVKRWGCMRCGKCCSSLEVPLTYEEEERLKKYGDVFRRGRIGVYLKKNGACIFFDGNCSGVGWGEKMEKVIPEVVKVLNSKNFERVNRIKRLKSRYRNVKI